MRLLDDVHPLLQEALLPNNLDPKSHHNFRVSQSIAAQSHVIRNTVAVLHTNGLRYFSRRDDFRQQIKYIKQFFGRFQFDDFVMVYHKQMINCLAVFVDLKIWKDVVQCRHWAGFLLLDL